MGYAVAGIIFAIVVLVIYMIIVPRHYKEVGGQILDEFDKHPFLAWLKYGFKGKELAEQYYEPQHSEDLDLTQLPDWALSEDEKKVRDNVTWHCSECGKTNSGAVKMCSCGAIREQTDKEV